MADLYFKQIGIIEHNDEKAPLLNSIIDLLLVVAPSGYTKRGDRPLFSFSSYLFSIYYATFIFYSLELALSTKRQSIAAAIFPTKGYFLTELLATKLGKNIDYAISISIQQT